MSSLVQFMIKNHTNEFAVSQITTLDVANQNGIQQSSITKVQNLVTDWMNSSLIGNVNSNGYITNENLVNQIAYDLGLATDVNSSNSKVKDIRIEKSDESLLQTYGINLNILISLNEDQTWSESMFNNTNSLTGVVINDQNQLVVVQKIPTNVEAHLGDVSVSDENLTVIQSVITSALNN